MGKKADEFKATVQKLVDFHVNKAVFCCDKHKAIFLDLRTKAVAFLEGKGDFTDKQVTFARDIVMGRMEHFESSKDKAVTITCIEQDCEEQVTGTRLEMGSVFKNRCEAHRN